MPRGSKRSVVQDFTPFQAQFEAMSRQLFELYSQKISEKVSQLEQKAVQCEQIIAKLRSIFKRLMTREKITGRCEGELSKDGAKLIYTRSTTFDTLSGRKSSDQ